ncbi:MAG: cupin domain-containing protein [Bacteroidia bacterium]
MEKINLKEKLEQFQEQWNPKIIGELDGMQIKIAKLKGEFDWHSHENEDEMFLVLKGQLQIRFRDREERLKEGEMIIIPKGVEHLPIAGEEVHVMLIEKATTVNTGNLRNDRTRNNLERI